MMKKIVIGNNIYSAVKTVYIISKIFLVCPFTLQKKLTFVITKVDIVIIVLQICYFLKFNYDNFFMFFLFQHSGTTFDFGLDAIEFIITYCATVLDLTNFYIHRKTISIFLQNINALTNQMSTLNFKIMYDKYVIKNLAFLLYCIILNIASTIASVTFDTDLPFSYFIYLNYTSSMTSITLCLCGIFLYDTKKRFEGINLYINSEMIVNSNRSIQNHLVTILKTIKKLTIQSSLINKILYLPSLIMLISIFYTTVSYLQGTLYQSITMEINYIGLLTMSTWYFVYYTSVILFLVTSLNNLRYQV